MNIYMRVNFNNSIYRYKTTDRYTREGKEWINLNRENTDV